MRGMTLDRKRLPKHVAIIMDGNGRWALRHKLEIARGHRRGTEAVLTIIRDAVNLKLDTMSLFAFSTENWERPREEVETLMSLMLEFFVKEIDELCEKNVHLRILGDKSRLPDAQREALLEAEAKTERNTGLNLNIGINYGARAELARAARTLAEEVAAGTRAPSDIDEAALSGALYTAGLPDVDLVIRTSGEMRLSNFLLYQCAYAEFVFPKVLWPDFNIEDFHDAMIVYQMRKRRYGRRF